MHDYPFNTEIVMELENHMLFYCPIPSCELLAKSSRVFSIEKYVFRFQCICSQIFQVTVLPRPDKCLFGQSVLYKYPYHWMIVSIKLLIRQWKLQPKKESLSTELRCKPRLWNSPRFEIRWKRWRHSTVKLNFCFPWSFWLKAHSFPLGTWRSSPFRTNWLADLRPWN